MLSKESVECHLTSEGWVRGSMKTQFADSTTTVEPPLVRFKTVVWHEHIGAMGATPDVWSETTYQGAEDSVEELEARYGPCRNPFRPGG